MQRRTVLKTLGALTLPLSAPALFAADPAAPAGLKGVGKPQPFDYAWLKGRARALAGKAYEPSKKPIPDAVKNLDWDQFQAIRYRANHALWATEHPQFQVRFFHLGLFFLSAVRMHEVVNGQAQDLA
jgi:glucans biosynthesis protein